MSKCKKRRNFTDGNGWKKNNRKNTSKESKWDQTNWVKKKMKIHGLEIAYWNGAGE